MTTPPDEIQPPGSERTLHCPKCGAAMEKVTFQTITVDRCVQCKGIWFDALEHEHLKQLAGSETIDVGPPGSAPASTPKAVNCPVCHTPMIGMVDHQHPHLRYESCTVCYGVFFDAGEFRDYKGQGAHPAQTVMERFRDVFHFGRA